MTDKQCYKPNDEIAQETIDNNNAAAIIKSASTPASLQTIVRFSNGSNMSLQHKVMKFYIKYFRECRERKIGDIEVKIVVLTLKFFYLKEGHLMVF